MHISNENGITPVQGGMEEASYMYLSNHLSTDSRGERAEKQLSLSPPPAKCYNTKWQDEEYTRICDQNSCYSSSEDSEPPSPAMLASPSMCDAMHGGAISRTPAETPPLVVALESPQGGELVLVDLGPDNVDDFFRHQFNDDDNAGKERCNPECTRKKHERCASVVVNKKDIKKIAKAKESVMKKKEISDCHIHKGPGGNGRKLWEFLLSLLCDPQYNPTMVKWLDVRQGIFTFTDSRAAACLWGQRRGHYDMSYEHMSRAIRHYYKGRVILRVPGRRLVYQFGPNARGWWQKVKKSKTILKEEEEFSSSETSIPYLKESRQKTTSSVSGGERGEQKQSNSQEMTMAQTLGVAESIDSEMSKQMPDSEQRTGQVELEVFNAECAHETNINDGIEWTISNETFNDLTNTYIDYSHYEYDQPMLDEEAGNMTSPDYDVTLSVEMAAAFARASPGLDDCDFNMAEQTVREQQTGNVIPQLSDILADTREVL